MSEPAFDLAAYKEQVFDKPTEMTVVPPAEPTPATPVSEPAPVVPIQAEPVTPEPVIPPATPDTPVVSEPVILDDTDFIKQHLGYDDVAKVKADLEELKRLRETPQTPAEIAFANEESKKIHELLRQGKTKEVKEYLQAQETLSNLDSMNEEQKLKLFIKMQNPKFDDELVDYKHQQLYKLDESSFTDDLGEIDPFKQRLAKVELAQRIENDIQKAKDFFAQYQTKIDLPDIAPAQLSQQSPEEEKAYQESLKQQEALDALWNQSLTKLSENDISLQFNFNDEANKIKFDVDYKMDKAGFEKARTAALTYGEYLKQTYNKPDGSPAADKLIRNIYVEQNLDKIVAESNKQAVNSTIKWFLANQKNISDSVQRNYTTIEPNEIDEIRSKVFGKTG